MSFLNHKISHKITAMLFFLFFYTSFGYATNRSEIEEAFEQAWNNPEYTQITLDDVNINETIIKHYNTPIPIYFTRHMLWDMETKKAWDPKTYIPYVVKEGNAWGKEILKNGMIQVKRCQTEP